MTELDDLCREAQHSCDKIEAQLSAKDEDLALLEGHIEEMKFSPANQDDSYQTEELKQDMVRKEVELESLQSANKDAQEWMAFAVIHADKLTTEVQEK